MRGGPAALTTRGFAKCEKPRRYIQQLVSHWNHKMPVSYDAGSDTGSFRFSESDKAEVKALPEGIFISLSAADEQRVQELKQVVERHLDRFAFREAPLAFQWSDQ
jgi:hypothetical protein